LTAITLFRRRVQTRPGRAEHPAPAARRHLVAPLGVSGRRCGATTGPDRSDRRSEMGRTTPTGWR